MFGTATKIPENLGTMHKHKLADTSKTRLPNKSTRSSRIGSELFKDGENIQIILTLMSSFVFQSLRLVHSLVFNCTQMEDGPNFCKSREFVAYD